MATETRVALFLEYFIEGTHNFQNGEWILAGCLDTEVLAITKMIQAFGAAFDASPVVDGSKERAKWYYRSGESMIITGAGEIRNEDLVNLEEGFYNAFEKHGYTDSLVAAKELLWYNVLPADITEDSFMVENLDRVRLVYYVYYNPKENKDEKDARRFTH